MSKTVIELNTAAAELIAWLDCCGIESHFVEKVRAKLAEQPAPVQQEPWAWLFQHEETGLTQCVDTQQVEWGFEKNNPRWQKIAPIGAKQLNADYRALVRARDEILALREALAEQPAPAAHEWVGLARKEVHDLYDSDYEVFHRRIEAKLKEKNT